AARYPSSSATVRKSTQNRTARNGGSSTSRSSTGTNCCPSTTDRCINTAYSLRTHGDAIASGLTTSTPARDRPHPSSSPCTTTPPSTNSYSSRKTGNPSRSKLSASTATHAASRRE